MRAIVLRKTGGAEELRLEDVPDPTPGPDEVLVRVRAAAVCGRDVIDRRGGMPMMKLPTILGHEFAGEVTALGARAAEESGFRVGDRVVNLHRPFCGACDPCRRGDLLFCERAFQAFGVTVDGGYAEAVVAHARALVALPAAVGFEAASTVMCTAGVALRALRSIGRLVLGETVLVTGASGGVGAYAIQIARSMGARVIATTTSEAKAERLAELGAHEVIVSAKSDFQDEVKRRGGADVALELTGAITFGAALRSLRRGGRMVIVGNIETRKLELNPGALILFGLSLSGSFACTARDLGDVLAMLSAGTLRPVIDRVLPLAEAAEAHRVLEARGAFGRIVLVP